MKPCASIEAVPKPDLSIGSDPTAATGLGVSPPTAHSIAVLSRRGDPVTFLAKVASEGLLPGAMRLLGSGGNSLFAVSYITAGGLSHRRGDRRLLRHGGDGVGDAGAGSPSRSRRTRGSSRRR